MCLPFTSYWLQRNSCLLSLSLYASLVFCCALFHANILWRCYNVERNTAFIREKSFSFLLFKSPNMNFKFMLRLKPDQTLQGTVIRTSGPCLEPALMVGEPQHPFPSAGSPAPRGPLVNTARQPRGQLACKTSLVRGLLERGGGLNSKSRLCESSAILIAKRAPVPGVPLRLSGNIKAFHCVQKKKWGNNAPRWLYVIMWCYNLRNNKQARGVYREAVSPWPWKADPPTNWAAIRGTRHAGFLRGFCAN